jgi:hypothetical protein
MKLDQWSLIGFRLETNKKKTYLRKNSFDADGEGMVASWRAGFRYRGFNSLNSLTGP